MSADSCPSYDELAGLVTALTARLEALEQQLRVVVVAKDAEIAGLRAENAELRRRLGMDSTNSSKPPSSNSPFTKPAPKSLRGKSAQPDPTRPPARTSR